MEAGDKVDGYQLVKRLGKGATAEVWLAIDPNCQSSSPLDRQVAIKIFLKNDDQH